MTDGMSKTALKHRIGDGGSPDWHWKSEVRNAKILSIEKALLPVEWRLNKLRHRCLAICLESESEDPDKRMMEVRLKNGYIEQDDLLPASLKDGRWVSDCFVVPDVGIRRYALCVKIQKDEQDKPITMTIDFDDVEVIYGEKVYK